MENKRVVPLLKIFELSAKVFYIIVYIFRKSSVFPFKLRVIGVFSFSFLFEHPH